MPQPRFSGPPFYFKDPNEEDHFAMLRQDLQPMRARYLRFKIWWDINDKFRESECNDPAFFSPEQEDNLRRLFGILDDTRPTDWLLKAEIHRELGEFDAALEIVAWLDDHQSFATSHHGYEFLHRMRKQSKMARLQSRKVVRYD